MKGFIAFVLLSAVVHAGALLTLPEGGIDGQGNAGEDTLTLATGSEALAALAQEWDRPPNVSQPTAMAPPTLPDMTPQISADTAVQSLSRPSLPVPQSDAPPQVVLTPAPALATPSANVAIAPSLPGFQAPADTSPTLPGQDTPRPGSTAPSLSVASVATIPQPDTRPHFEGATALATDTSPRPATRPNDLAPAPVVQPQSAAPRPQTSAPDRTAAGSGGATTQGAAPTPQPAPQATVSAAQIQSAMAQWGGQIQSRIASRRPSVNGTGRATVQLRVGRNGQLQGLGLARSSGNPAVDQAALDAVRRAGRFPRAPAALTDAAYTFSLPVTFQ